MSLTPQDIQDKQFHVRFRGFDIEEVDAFLELIFENFSALVEENRELQRRVDSLSTELDGIKEQESSFRSAMISAKSLADEMVTKSREEANELRERAREQVKSMREEAQEEISQLKDEAHKEIADLERRVDELREMESAFERDMQQVILTYQEKLSGHTHEAYSVEESTPKETEAQSTWEVLDLEDDEAEPEEEAESTPVDDESLEGDGPESEGAPDLTDLYEKIDLGENLGGDSLAAAQDDHDDAVDEDDQARLVPDLESEVVFSLQDPLEEDDEPVDVVISRDSQD